MDDFLLLRRIEALEAQVTLLSQHAGVPCPMFASTGFAVATNPMAPPAAAPHAGGPPPQLSPAQIEIVELARSGNKLEAIKRYRELTGADLAEAKRFIETI
jgi:ribosomal protein L7/L12